MSTVIYLSNRYVQIATGKTGDAIVSVETGICREIPEGILINGIVMDRERFVSYIRAIWTENSLNASDVTLVANTTKFIGQVMEVPVMKDGLVLDYVKREFLSIGRGEDIYGFTGLDMAENGLKRIYADCIYSEQIRDYVDIFAEAGVTVKRIYSGEAAMINLMTHIYAHKKENLVLQILDGINLITMLYIGGRFTYYNSARCLYNEGTEEFGLDIVRSVSNIKQFMKANQIDAELDHIYLAGIAPDSMEVYRTVFENSGFNTPLSVFTAEDKIQKCSSMEAQKYLFAISGLMNSGNDSEFIANMEKQEKAKTGLVMKPEMKKLTIFGAALVIGWIVLFLLQII